MKSPSPNQRSKMILRSVAVAKSTRLHVVLLTVIIFAYIVQLGNGVTRNQKSSVPFISTSELDEMVNRAINAVDRRLTTLEPNIYKNGIVLQPGTAAWFAAASAKTKVAAKNVSRMALVVEETTKILAQKFGLTKEQISDALPTADVRGTALERDCPLTVDFPCQPRRYRAYSGYCNNVQNPKWGNSNTRYIRYHSPDYADGVSVPRSISEKGGLLPSALLVSKVVHSTSERPHPHLTVFMAVFAEFIFHDIYHTSVAAGYRGHRIRCCSVPMNLMHPECFAMHSSNNAKITTVNDENDSDGCMEYVRSCSVPRTGCTLGPREQINQVTSFLDGSVVYGSSSEEVRRLRSFQGGMMKVQNADTDASASLLPPDTANVHDCKTSSNSRPSHHCFLAGDVRVNENAGLMAMHTVWIREHNRIASRLSNLNPHWNDDQVFEEARRILVAELQHVTFSELLPALVGVQVVRQFGLEPVAMDLGYYSGYDIDVNPGTSNAVATSVATSLYSMMPSRFHLFSVTDFPDDSTRNARTVLETRSPDEGPVLERVGSALMSETHFSPGPLYEGTHTLDKLLFGMANQRAHAMDPFVATNSVDKNRNSRSGDAVDNMDRVALVIQQGRDHGIPGYLQWRKICRLQPTITNFTNLHTVMSADAAKRISNVYKDLRDVDLFTGGVSENPLVGGVVGPTFACLLSRQFQHLRRGDRYWYENDLPPSSFTRDQLNEIKKATLARILCDNSDALPLVQPSLMFIPDPYLNAFQACDTAVPVVDLMKWKSDVPTSDVPTSTILNSLRTAKKQAEERMAAEWEVFSNNIGVADSKSPQAMHHVFLRPKRQSNMISNISLILELASHNYMMRTQTRDAEVKPSDAEVSATMLALSTQDVREYIEDVMISRTKEENAKPRATVRLCKENDLPCDHTSPFRTLTGWCNNLQHPEWGKSFRVFQRLLQPKYGDGVSSPRSQAISGQDLPSPRLVSTAVHYDTEASHGRYTLSLMQWGQFLDHDLTLTPMYDAGGRPLDCKSCNSASTIHPECLPIQIPGNDPFFPKQRNGSCISFARSLAGQLTLGSREQLDQVTSFIDASNVYGSDSCEARMLRELRDGRLNITRHPNRNSKDLLPQDLTNVECRAPSGVCFEAGDIRASEQPGLTVMHTVWMREHNRIVNELSKINSQWDDETLYQQARRIVSAMMQHITYAEFLPRVLGESTCKKWSLQVSSANERKVDSEDENYDPKCDATMFNEFAAAAFRFGHTLLKPTLPRLDHNFRSVAEGPINLRNGFFNPDKLYEDGVVDQLIRGLLSYSIEGFDHSITSEVTNHLFEDSTRPFSGMDLVALNLQRGRDHGLPAYNDYREWCNRTRARDFNNLMQDIPEDIVRRLQAVYENVDDIDLFSGGVSEKPMYGALVGPTFGCIISIQFRHLKRCDRFWYETKDPYLRLTSGQLAEIRKVRLAKVMCENSDSVDSVQQSAFDLPDDFLNPRMPCSSLNSLDLSQWKESPGCNLRTNRVTDTSRGKSIPLGQSSPVSPCVSCACTKEGLVCQSLKVTNCFQLASRFSMAAVLEDDVCKVQCAFAFRAYPQFESPLLLDNALGFSSGELR